MKKIILSGLFPEEICEKLNISQQFRGKQIFKWISKGVSDFSQMTNLSSALREELSQKAEIFSSKEEDTMPLKSMYARRERTAMSTSFKGKDLRERSPRHSI